MMPAVVSQSATCPICRHRYARAELSKHHLVPKSRKGKETVLLCRNCHRQIHALYTEKELEHAFGTLDALLAADRLQPWIAWVRKRKPSGRLRTKDEQEEGAEVNSGGHAPFNPQSAETLRTSPAAQGTAIMARVICPTMGYVGTRGPPRGPLSQAERLNRPANVVAERR